MAEKSATLISGSGAKIDASNAALNVAAGNNGNLNQGTIDRTNFGPQTNTKHIEGVNVIEHATITNNITNIHHHHGRDEKSEESTTEARPKRTAEKPHVLSPALPRKKKKAVFNKEGADITNKDLLAGGNFGTSSGTMRASPEQTKEESTTGARPKETVEKEGFRLSDSIWIFKERRLGKKSSKKSSVFGGVQESELFPDKLLAIKLIWDYTKKNMREAENLLKLGSHANVVAIVKADVYKKIVEMKCLYIAMERCSTLNLEDYIKERRSKNVPFNPNEALEHAEQVVDGIKHIHRYNILHRDLKPSSVLFSVCRQYVKICDFGMSKKMENGHSVTGLSTLKIGTDGYRAPETYDKNVISKMADIFSLALVLYHLLSYGCHPFGIDPTIWSYNIKNGQSLDLSRLRDPFFEIVKELLEQMLKFEPKDRLKIGQVKNSEFMTLDWFSSVIESLVPIWNGTVKDHVGADMLSCRLYRSYSLQDVIEINESGWKFEMNTVSYFDIGSLKKVTDEEPSGYIEASKDELKKLTGKLAGNLVGWIDISKYGKVSKVIVLLFQPGYPELFGFFFPDTKILISFIENLPPEQRSKLQKPAAGPVHLFASAQLSNSPDHIRESPNLQAQSSVPSSTSAESAPVSTETSGITSGIVDQKKQEVASAKWKQTSRGLIPWWIYTGDLQK